MKKNSLAILKAKIRGGCVKSIWGLCINFATILYI